MQSEEPSTAAAQELKPITTMQSKETPAPKGRGRELAPLGAMLKGLEVNQHIVVDYPEGTTPTMAAAIKHYRSMFKMNLLYRQTAPGKFEIWRATVGFERKTKLAPPGQQLKSLQFGQRITVDYATDNAQSFALTMAHYRKYLKKPFLYERKGAGTFEVWLGTAEEVVRAHRGLRHTQTPLTEAELQALQKHPEIHRDIVTVVLMAMRCGIPVSIGRHLLWRNVHLDDKQIEFRMRGAPFPVTRPLPDDVLKHLQLIHPSEIGDQTPLCPTIAGLANKLFQDSWPRVRKLLRLPSSRTLSALTWPWKKLNPGLAQKEIALNHIAALEKKWLSAAELKITAKLGALAENIIPLPTAKDARSKSPAALQGGEHRKEA
jgi:hypothetical protein